MTTGISMFFDRTFALVAAAGFASGVADHILWLAAGFDATTALVLKTTSLGLCCVVLIYVVAYAGKRDGLAYDRDELLLFSLLAALPKSSVRLTYGMLIYGLLLQIAAVGALAISDRVIEPICVLREGLSGQDLSAQNCSPLELSFTSMVFIFAALAYAETVYLLGVRRAK